MPRKKADLDQFEVIGRIPKGMAYQWCALKVLGNSEIADFQLDDFKRGGWKPVPAKRHPKMRHRGAHIIFGDQILMERKAALSSKARKLEMDSARAMLAESKLEEAKPSKFDLPLGGSFEFPDGPFEAQDVEITLTLRLPSNRVEAAAVCGMTIERYAAVMAILLREKALTGILIPTDDGKAFELKELLVSRTTEQ